MSATPGPWKVTPLLRPGEEHMLYFIEQRPGVSLAQMNGPCLMYSNAENDARFIVRACNAHEELLSALRAVDEFLENPPKEFGDYLHARRPVRAAIRDAIQKATEA